MNTNLRSIVMFALGAGAGSFITWRVLKEQYDVLLLSEIESVKEVYGRGGSDPKEYHGDGTDLVDEGFYTSNSEPPVLKERMKYKRYVKENTPYNEIRKANEGLLANLAEPEPADKDTSCYVISISQFGAEREDYETLSLSYYEGDDTLADEKDEIIQDVIGTVGEGLLCFGDQSEDPDVVYVRNERLGIDYEIVRLHKSYQETVLGIHSAPSLSKRILVRRRPNEES